MSVLEFMYARISAGELFGFIPPINISVSLGAAVIGRMAGACGSEFSDSLSLHG